VAHAVGVTVESELGRLAGSEAGMDVSDEEAYQTDPDQAKRFMHQSGADVLAVSIGNAHGFYKGRPHINFERLERIASAVDAPLVLHGGSDLSEEIIKKAISLGICKINICTEFVHAFGSAFTQVQRQDQFTYNVPSLFSAAREQAKQLVKKKMALFASK